MSDCEDCARARVGTWCGYHLRCAGCTARGIARSLVAWNALHRLGSGDRQSLRELIATALPEVSTNQARELVWSWWTHDHPEDATA